MKPSDRPCVQVVSETGGVRVQTQLDKLVPSERRKVEKVMNIVTVMQNTDAADSKHVLSVSDLLKLSKENPELLSPDIVEFLYDLFKKSMDRSLSEKARKQFVYDFQTSRNLLETLLMAYQHNKEAYPQLLELFKEMLEQPTRMQFAGNPSRYAHIPMISTIVRFFKDDTEILAVFRLKKLLTQMEGFYITSESAYVNQSVFMERALESIVINVSRFVKQDPYIMMELFERLAMLYERTHPIRHDHALIEYRHVTIESIIRELKARHIPLLIENPHIHGALILFFTRDFHHPSKKILNRIKSLLWKSSDELQKIGIQILSARELSGETASSYVSTTFEGRAKWVQPPRTAPSRLTPSIVRRIKELALTAPSVEVRALAQKVVQFVETQEKKSPNE